MATMKTGPGQIELVSRRTTFLQVLDRVFTFRGMVALGIFALVWHMLDMLLASIGQPKSLIDSPVFMSLLTLLIGTGGIGIVAQFAYGGTKTGSETMTKQSDAVISQAGTTPPPGTGDGTAK